MELSPSALHSLSHNFHTTPWTSDTSPDENGFGGRGSAVLKLALGSSPPGIRRQDRITERPRRSRSEQLWPHRDGLWVPSLLLGAHLVCVGVPSTRFPSHRPHGWACSGGGWNPPGQTEVRSTGRGEELGRKGTCARGTLECEACRSGRCMPAPGPCTSPPPTANTATWGQQAPAAQHSLRGAEGADST